MRMAKRVEKAGPMVAPCGGCSATTGTKEPGVVGAEIYRCGGCGGLVGSCYKGDSYGLVRPYFVSAQRAAEFTAAEEAGRYYDLQVLGSDGVSRRHGWYDPETRGIIQVG